MVSILIPTYNYDVTELVINIWQQCQKESFPFEIIVIDDCSTNLQITEKNKTIKNWHYITQKVKINMEGSKIRSIKYRKAINKNFGIGS